MITLVRPPRTDIYGIWDMRAEFLANGDHIYGSSGCGHCDDYESWYQKSVCDERPTEVVRVPQYTYVSIEDGKAVGFICLRTHLTPEIALTSGNIGYSVRPSMRKRGYGKAQLVAMLKIAREMGLNEAMVTCDINNIASASTALAAGGREIGMTNPEPHEYVRRFMLRTC